MTPMSERPFWKQRRWQIVAALAYLALWIGFYRWWHSAAWEFERTVVVGMAKPAVQEAAGNADQILNAGETLARWGSAEQREVSAETWVYFVIPKSQNRFVVEFKDGRVASVERQPN